MNVDDFKREIIIDYICKNWYINDTKGELVLMGSVYKNSKGGV